MMNTRNAGSYAAPFTNWDDMIDWLWGEGYRADSIFTGPHATHDQWIYAYDQNGDEYEIEVEQYSDGQFDIIGIGRTGRGGFDGRSAQISMGPGSHRGRRYNMYPYNARAKRMRNLRRAKGFPKSAQTKSAYNYINSVVDEVYDLVTLDAPYQDESELERAIDDCIDNKLIYDSDIWEIAQAYLSASDLVGMFYEEFLSECYSAIMDDPESDDLIMVEFTLHIWPDSDEGWEDASNCNWDSEIAEVPYDGMSLSDVVGEFLDDIGGYPGCPYVLYDEKNSEVYETNA